jgi:hypothetical protein
MLRETLNSTLNSLTQAFVTFKAAAGWPGLIGMAIFAVAALVVVSGMFSKSVK